MHQQAIDKPNASPRHPDAQAGFARQLDQRITHHLSQLAPAPARLVEAARDAIAALDGCIMPFPGGIVRSGSKIGGKYKGMMASTNDAYCPTLKGTVDSALSPDIGSVLEIVIDGLSFDHVAAAMRAGLSAAVALGPDRGATRISAGNYGGKLGPHHFKLLDLLP